MIHAYEQVVGGDSRFKQIPSWKDYLEKKTLPNRKQEQKLQFLGLVSLYTNNTASKVCAFHIHSLVLYRATDGKSPIQVELIMTQEELTLSSIQERLLQIMQLLQFLEKGKTSFTFTPSFKLP